MVRTRRTQGPTTTDPKPAAGSGSDSPDIEEGIVAPVRKTRTKKVAKKQPVSKPKAVQNINRRKKAEAVQEASDDEGEAAPTPPPQKKDTRRRGGTRGRSDNSTPPPPSSDEGEADETSRNAGTDEEDKSFVAPTPKPKKGGAGGRQKNKSPPPPVQDASVASSTSSAQSSSPVSRASVASSTAAPVARTGGSGNSRAGISGLVKKEITEFIKDCLDDCQRMNSRQRRSLYISFRQNFYKDRNIVTANDYQKYFAQSFWSFSLLFFKAANSHPVQAALKFILHIVLNAGTPDDKAEEGFRLDTYPLYYYVLKLYLQCHMDERPMVRLRIISIAHEILSQYRKVAPLDGHTGMKTQLVHCFLERLKDRYAPVRAVAATCLRFYAEDEIEVIKRLKYFARFDPSPEVRRAVLSALADMHSIRTTFFYDFVFDSDAKVRVEAFSALAARPMSHLKPEEASKAIIWGLSHDDKSKNLVVGKLLPAWLDQRARNPVEFLRHLGIVKKPQAVETVMNGVYLNNFTDTFNAIDLSFLNEDKVIPIENLTLESVMFWMYLIKKFGNTRHNKDKLLPNAEFMLGYLQQIIDGIHLEHRTAHQEDRDEDATLLMCMTYMVPIVLAIGLEEANRRHLGEILKEILLDPVMDDAPVIKMGVDALFKILDRNTFADKMMEIFQTVFEPDQTIMDQTLEGRLQGTPRTPSTKRRSVRPGSKGPDISPTGETSHRENGKDEGDIIAPMDVDVDNEVGVVNAAGERGEVTPPSNPVSRGTRRVLTEKELLAMKNKLCKLALERLRFAEEKTNAIKSDNYLEAHRIQQQIDVLCLEEKATRARMELANGTVGSMSDFSVSSKSSRRTNETSMMEMEEMELEEEHDSTPLRASAQHSRATSKGSRSRNQTGSRTIQEEDFPLSQATTAGGDRVGISLQNILRGVVMMNRFLSCRPKMTPFVRQFYDIYAISHFTNETNDYSVRSEVLRFLCQVGMIDSDEKRKIMGLIITALEHDTHPEVKDTAFRCMVDLLCRYEVKEFQFHQGDTDQVYKAAPAEYNKDDASLIELQAMFVSLIDKYATTEVHTPEAESVKAGGIMKLLTADRITSEFVVADVLCMWCNPTYGGTKIPYEIGIWLPIYTKMSLQNARLVGKALFISVGRISNASERKNSALQGVDIVKLVDFVLPFVSTSHIKTRDDDYINIHEDIYETIIEHILQQTRKTVNLDLVQILHKLNVQSEQKAPQIVEEISHALLKLSAMPPTPSVATLKTALKKAGKRIATQFPELEEQLMEILSKADDRGVGDDNSDDDEASDPNPFSDDDENEDEGEK